MSAPALEKRDFGSLRQIAAIHHYDRSGMRNAPHRLARLPSSLHFPKRLQEPFFRWNPLSRSISSSRESLPAGKRLLEPFSGDVLILGGMAERGKLALRSILPDLIQVPTHLVDVVFAVPYHLLSPIHRPAESRVIDETKPLSPTFAGCFVSGRRVPCR